MKLVLLCVTVLVMAAVPGVAMAQPGGSEEEVVRVVQRFFDAMAAQDTTAARATLMDEGQVFGVGEDSSGVHISGFSNRQFLERLATRKENLLERMWNPKVLVHDRVAVLWAPYDFHINGEFSHCGVDAFNLVKTAEGWKIAGAVFTMERTGCEPSPLGPPD